MTRPDEVLAFGSEADGQWLPVGEAPVVFSASILEPWDVDSPTETKAPVPTVYVLRKYGWIPPDAPPVWHPDHDPACRWEGWAYVREGDRRTEYEIAYALTGIVALALMCAGWRPQKSQESAP